MPPISLSQFAQPYGGGAITEEDMYDLLQGLMFPTATDTELDDIADPINTTRKSVGKQVFNTTSGLVVVADAAGAGGTWSATEDGLVDHTPS